MKFSQLPQRIMTQLNLSRIQKLGTYWQTAPEGLDLRQFAQLMIESLNPANDDEKYELVYGCFKLFNEVDINGDGSMEWGEFMQYIIDAVSDNTIKQGGKNQASVREQIQQLAARKYHRFEASRKVVDKTNHWAVISNAVFCQSAQLVFCAERFGKELKFYEPGTQRLVDKATPPYVKPGFINSVAYDERSKLFGCCTTDGQLHFLQKTKTAIEYLKSITTIAEQPRKRADGSFEKAEVAIQSRIFYLPKQQLWLTAGMDFKLRHWAVHKTGAGCLLGDPLKLHKDEITDCVELVNPRCIITCSMDRTIVFYDMNARQRLNKIEPGKHEMGIRCLRI